MSHESLHAKSLLCGQLRMNHELARESLFRTLEFIQILAGEYRGMNFMRDRLPTKMSQMPGNIARRTTMTSSTSSFTSSLSRSRSIRLLPIKEDDCQIQVERVLGSPNLFLYSCQPELHQADIEILDRLMAKIILSKAHTNFSLSPKDVEPVLQKPRISLDDEHLYMISENLKPGMDLKETLQVLFTEVYEHGYIMNLLNSRSENTQTDILISILAATTKNAKSTQRTSNFHTEADLPEWEKEVALWESKKAMRREADEKAKMRFRSASDNFAGYRDFREKRPGEKRLFRLPRWLGPWKYERDAEEDGWLLEQMKEKQTSHLLWVYHTVPPQPPLSGGGPLTRSSSTQERRNPVAVEGSAQWKPASPIVRTQETTSQISRSRTISAPPRTGAIQFLRSVAEKPHSGASQKTGLK